jgi:hypothetical protein
VFLPKLHVRPVASKIALQYRTSLMNLCNDVLKAFKNEAFRALCLFWRGNPQYPEQIQYVGSWAELV